MHTLLTSVVFKWHCVQGAQKTYLFLIVVFSRYSTWSLYIRHFHFNYVFAFAINSTTTTTTLLLLLFSTLSPKLSTLISGVKFYFYFKPTVYNYPYHILIALPKHCVFPSMFDPFRLKWAKGRLWFMSFKVPKTAALLYVICAWSILSYKSIVKEWRVSFSPSPYFLDIPHGCTRDTLCAFPQTVPE
jgi:hypothetical protein